MFNRQPLNLYVDMHNLAWITRHSRLTTPKTRYRKDPHAKDLIRTEMMRGIIGAANQHAATGVILALEGGSWRRGIYPEYKMKENDEEDIYKEEVTQAVEECAEFFRNHTAALVLKVLGAEGDDIIAFGVQNTAPGIKSLILSSDKDFMQLLYDDVSLYSMTQREFRQTDDPTFELFLKCIRGDTSDNIPSAYPRVRLDRLRKAWDDPYELQNLLEETNIRGEKVEDVFLRNASLIDLNAQPNHIRDSMEETFVTTPTGKFRQLGIAKALKEEFNLGDEFCRIFDGKHFPFIKAPVFQL